MNFLDPTRRFHRRDFLAGSATTAASLLIAEELFGAADSDSTKPAGYSTCQRASRFQFRTAVDSREVAPR